MQLYCRCGYPITVGGCWEGGEYHLALRDGVRGDGHGRSHDSITRCPRCGEWLQLAALSWQPSASTASMLNHPEPHASP